MNFFFYKVSRSNGLSHPPPLKNDFATPLTAHPASHSTAMPVRVPTNQQTFKINLNSFDVIHTGYYRMKKQFSYFRYVAKINRKNIV